LTAKLPSQYVKESKSDILPLTPQPWWTNDKYCKMFWSLWWHMYLI